MSISHQNPSKEGPPPSGRSRFLDNLNTNGSFQPGVNESLWTNPPDAGNTASRKGSVTAAGLFDTIDGPQTRPSSSGSRLLNGSTSRGQSVNGEGSPARQRPVVVPSLPHPTDFDSFPSASGAFGRIPSDPVLGSFEHFTLKETFSASAGVSSRASSRHRQNSSGRDVSTGHITYWDFKRGLSGGQFSQNNSRVASQTNSQSVSRNNSLPPSRHGAEASPSQPSFSLGSFSEFRPGSYTPERPPSQGQMISNGPVSLSMARPSGFLGASTSASGNPAAGSFLSTSSLVEDAAPRNGTFVPRQTLTPSTGHISDQLQNLQLQNNLDGSVMNPQRPMLSASVDPSTGFPTLSEVQYGQNNNNMNSTRNDTGYINQVKQGRNFGQGNLTPQHFAYNTWQQPNASNYSNGLSRGANPYTGGPHTTANAYQYPLVADHQQHPRHTTMRPTHHQPRRNQGSMQRNFQNPMIPELASGRTWREQIRPNNGQKYIDTSPETRLKDALGHVARFCGDQNGSRFLQDKLEIANSEEKEAVFQELVPNTIQLCSDPFGNYVIQKFFEHGTQRQKQQLAAMMKGKVKDLSMNMYGCRCVQKAFEHVLCDQQALLVQELRPCLYEVSKDQQGNHVVQKAIERLPRKDIQFILHGYYDCVMDMSNDSYGCRVIQRLLEVEDDGTFKRRLIDEIDKVMMHIVRNPYGNYVIQHIIDHGSPEDRDRLIKTILPIIVELTNNKYASNVVEKCLRRGTPQQCSAIVARLCESDPVTNKPLYLKGTMTSNFGNYVIQRVLKTLTGEEWEEFARLIKDQLPEIAPGTSDKKVNEFQRLLDTGLRHAGVSQPIKKENDLAVLKARAAESAETPMPRKIERTNTASTEEGSAALNSTPPSLTRTHPSPQSSNTPSTSDSTNDEAQGLTIHGTDFVAKLEPKANLRNQ